MGKRYNPVYNAAYSAAHRAEKKAYNAAYHAAHRAEMLAYQANYRIQQRRTVLEHYGNKCICCGEIRPEFLAVDHVNNDGAQQRKRLGGATGVSFYNWIISHNYPDDLQLLCHNCNQAKAFYGQCPHELERVAYHAI